MINKSDKLNKFKRFGSKLGLERMGLLMTSLGNPQKEMNIIHVAGTNGKGSVCEYLYSVLMENGYSVGVYTSPFIDDFSERIRCNGKNISDEEFENLSDKVIIKADEMVRDGFDSPTEFEILTAIAFLYFNEEAPDFVIMEVGLGGTGDSTNIIDSPLVSVITSISYDHMDRLGNTIEEIAAEKAGIIKKDSVVISNVEDDGAKVIAKKTYEIGSPFINATKNKHMSLEKTPHYYRFTADIEGTVYPDIEISMIGMNQVRNAICALTVIEHLRKSKKISITKDSLQKGMKSAYLHGRCEILDDFAGMKGKTVILDGAHNESGAQALEETIDELYRDCKILTLIGILGDKKAEDIVKYLSVFSDGYIVTELNMDRKLPADELLGIIKDNNAGKPALLVETPEKAWDEAIVNAQDYDVILVTGSLYFIGDIRRIINGKN